MSELNKTLKTLLEVSVSAKIEVKIRYSQAKAILEMQQRIDDLEREKKALIEQHDMWKESFHEASANNNEMMARGVEKLNFPVVLRKMWSGGEVQQWISEQANQLRNQSKGGDDLLI